MWYGGGTGPRGGFQREGKGKRRGSVTSFRRSPDRHENSNQKTKTGREVDVKKYSCVLWKDGGEGYKKIKKYSASIPAERPTKARSPAHKIRGWLKKEW